MADANKINQIETKNITKVNSIEGKNLARIGNTPISFSQIPAGLIVFYNDTVIPANWERFVAPDDKMIIGAGLTYSIGDTGAGDVTKSIGGGATGTGGTHNLSPDFGMNLFGTNIGNNYTSRGSHSHTIGDLTYSPAKNKLVMIKSTIDQSEFPSKTVLMSKTNLGLTNILTTEKFMEAGSSIQDISEIANIDIASAGSHNHTRDNLDKQRYLADAQIHLLLNQGAHSDIYAATVSENLKKFLLSLWTNASSQFELQGNMIAMWESLTPPDGWNLCDGSNSTPDLRDCFIKSCNSGNEGSSSIGDGTLTLNSGSITHNALHNHSSSGGQSYMSLWQHSSNYTWSHSHSFPEFSGISWLPPYYALSFIIKS